MGSDCNYFLVFPFLISFFVSLSLYGGKVSFFVQVVLLWKTAWLLNCIIASSSTGTRSKLRGSDSVVPMDAHVAFFSTTEISFTRIVSNHALAVLRSMPLKLNQAFLSHFCLTSFDWWGSEINVSCSEKSRIFWKLWASNKPTYLMY